jgi:two-component system, LytTR family, sensor kinase
MSTPATSFNPAPRAPGTATAAIPAILSPRVWFPLFVGFWTFFGLLYAARDRYWATALGREAQPWVITLQHGLFAAYLTGVLAVLAFLVARKFPLESGSWLRNLLLHLLLGAAAIAGTVVLAHSVAPVLLGTAERRLLEWAVGVAPAWSLFYVLMLGIGYGIEYLRRARERELRTAHLAGQLARAQLQALNMELHPHFLFNALNSISALMHRDVRAADRMLGRLQDLFRLTLQKNGAHEVPLKDELEILEPYLEIEQARFGERLVIDWQVDADALEATVPQLVLQPIVENAIKYSIAPRSSRGRIRIAAFRDGGDLQLEVEDDGPGFQATARPAKRKGGVGLLNTRARLEQLYNGKHRLELTTGDQGGACVRIRFPFRLSLENPVRAAR